jgi:hypothetical protein
MLAYRGVFVAIVEAAVPLLTVLLLAVGFGFLVAWLMVTFINDTYRVTWPAPDYFTVPGLSLLLTSGRSSQHKGGAHGWTLRTDNADPSPCLAIVQAGICVVRSLWQVSRMIAQPGSAQDYEHNGSPLPQVVFERSSSGFQSISRELIPPRIGPEGYRSCRENLCPVRGSPGTPGFLPKPSSLPGLWGI